MRGPDRWSAGVLCLVGLVAMVEARTLRTGTFAQPGPGFFPFYLALALAIVGFALLVRSVSGRPPQAACSGSPSPGSIAASLEGPRPRQAEAPGALATGDRPERWRVFATVLALVLYALGLEPLGFLGATLILLLFLFRVVGRHGWPVALGGSVATTVLTYALFSGWLQVRLPPGLVGP